MIKGILFDLGGTLISYREVDTVIESILLETKQKKLTKLSIQELIILYKKASIAVTHSYIDRKFYLHKDLFLDIFKRFTDFAGIEADNEFFKWFSQRHEFLLIQSFSLIKNARKTLTDLNKKNLTVGIVSNIDSYMLKQILKKNEIEHLVDFDLSSESARSCKPDCKIFEIARRKTGLEKSELLFVGDSMEHDIVGSNKYGILNVFFSEKNITAPLQTGKYYEKPNYTIEDLSELSSLIFELNR
ncbi:HAD family hydrolase [Pseudomonadota bacterium]|nr:HAD family hydrolase [Pseudomonadota bacterium]MDC3067211.1 HAD family hydrolase [Pseudomonadota bacterium]